MTTGPDNSKVSGNILAVDDTPESLKLLVRLLRDGGYEVRAAINGELALNSAVQNPPDLILLDIRMPGQDGFEVCRHLKSQDSTRDVPVMFLSASSDTDDKVQGFALGAVDFVTKPYQQEELLARVHTHLELGRLRNRLEELVMSRTAEVQTLNRELEARVEARTAELAEANALLEAERLRQQALIDKLEQANTQLLQSEKMAAIGQLAAGVAHEINNPVSFVNSNLGTLDGYMGKLLQMLATYESMESRLPEPDRRALAACKNETDLNFLREDMTALLRESRDGVQRVKRIVADLRDFAHVDQGEWQYADLERGIDSTLNVVWNELKYKAEVVKAYGHPPAIRCLPSQINQVVMNLLVNAAQAIDTWGTITLRTGVDGDDVWIEVEDTGKGIAADSIHRVFEPFYTTKPVGKGTGLGLSVSYQIVKKHGGHFQLRSEPGKGTVFRVVLPQEHRQPSTADVDGRA